MTSLTRNKIFIAYCVFFVAVVIGLLPREAVIYATAFLIAWMAIAPLEEGTLFFIQTVPLFVAIPLTATYDNLNLWRPLAIVLFVRLLLQKETRRQLIALWKNPAVRMIAVLFLLAALSLVGAMYPTIGIKRIIYFANLLMVPAVLAVLLRQGTLTSKQVINAIVIPVMIVVVVGYLQLLSTYLIDIYQFMALWGEYFQLNQYGTEWSYIAVHVGNTWLAYYGPQLSLRVFSLFTDSHTFPMYVLLGMPALFAWIRGRNRWAMLWIPAAFLIVILSGTRGIWAAGVGAALIAVFLWWRTRLPARQARKPVFASLSRWMACFFLLFIIAWPIFISPQFLLGKGIDLRTRIRSIIDFGETSNAARLLIWKASLVSIAHHPLLGVGIGNFPVVLGQDIRLARAGSTAHNVYLHVAAEMGIPALLVFLALLVYILKKARDEWLVFIPWVLLYLLTDAALFDERAFLSFSIASVYLLFS